MPRSEALRAGLARTPTMPLLPAAVTRSPVTWSLPSLSLSLSVLFVVGGAAQTGRRLDGARFVHPQAGGSAAAGGAGGACAVRRVFPNQAGTRVIIVDAANRCWLFNPVDNLTMRITDAVEPPAAVLWDPADWGLFAMASPSALRVFLHRAHTVYGPTTERLGDLSVSMCELVTPAALPPVAAGGCPGACPSISLLLAGNPLPQTAVRTQ